MAEAPSMERLQPCLLDRLRDDNPGERMESRTQRVVSIQRYREAVLRDLGSLLNANPVLTPEEAKEFPEGAKSTLNYGVRDLAGQTSHDCSPAELERHLRDVIKTFEPRIDPRTLEVTAVRDESKVRVGRLAFEIRGELWAKPMPEQLFLRTQLDLETGDCTLS
jgi:type VI secretion system protein ImpF